MPTAPLTREQKLKIAWEHAQLHWMLDRNQIGIWEAVKGAWASKKRKFVLKCSRQMGKSFFLCVLAIQYALAHPGAQIKYAAPSAKMVKKILRPHFREILATCPKALRPTFHTQDGEYRFPNGSMITLAGCDRENAESLRGQHAHLAIVDEAGFIDDLKYVIDDILVPQTINTKGTIILASTPAKSSGHPFKHFCDEADADGTLVHRTIYDNPRVTPEEIERLKKEAGGEDSTTWKREYLAEDVTDEESAVIPEATEGRLREITREVPRPMFYDVYAGMDVGWSPDFTGLLWGWWWFEQATLVIEYEFVMRRMVTSTLAQVVKEMEADGFPGRTPYKRVSDTEERLIADLAADHKLYFIPTAKDNKDAAINNLRQTVSGQHGNLIIHPRCKALRRQLKNGTWNKQRTQFERSEVDGHYDLLDALIYLNRNVDRHRNPIPAGYGRDSTTQWINPHDRPLSASARGLLRLFGGK